MKFYRCTCVTMIVVGVVALLLANFYCIEFETQLSATGVSVVCAFVATLISFNIED